MKEWGLCFGVTHAGLLVRGDVGVSEVLVALNKLFQ